MKVLLNNRICEVSEQISVQELIAGQGLERPNVAVALNNRLVPRGEWADTHLNDGDKVVVITAAYGG